MINSSMAGTFIDYLIRRMIAEKREIEFGDFRASGALKFSCKFSCGCELNESTVTSLREMCWNNRWHDAYTTLFTKDELIEFINSKLVTKSCKKTIKSITTICQLPSCQYDAYRKMKNTTKYSTLSIIPDIFLVSLLHTESFRGCPPQDAFDRMYGLLQQTDRLQKELIEPLSEFIDTVLQTTNHVELNPILGDCFIPSNNITLAVDYFVQADADIILDSTLIDTKCTEGDKEMYEILQLLGYAALAHVRGTPIRTIQIWNLLKGTETTYDVDYSSETWHNFLHMIIGLKNTDMCSKCLNNKK